MGLLGILRAESPAWKFAPPRAGLALYEGGWSLEYPLGEVAVSPEFSFPLQLVSLNTRDASGLFGRAWFCPQLESSLVPRDRGLAVWTTPAGAVIVLRADPARQSELRSANGEWRGRSLGARFVLTNEEGWRYSYQRGRLDAVDSPTGRSLEFLRDGGKLVGLQLRDPVSGQTQPILTLAYAEGGRRVIALDVNGRRSRFAYRKDGAADRLAAWQPEFGWPVEFRYDERTGGLTGRRTDRAGKVEVFEFRAEYIPAEKPADDTPQRRLDAAAYRLVADGEFAYAYPAKDQIVLTPREGGPALTGSYQPARGVLTTNGPAGKQRLIHYRAPGRRYDGRLRRVEQDGRVLQEFRYDRKTGQLKETVDAKGLITFYEYADDSSPRWEPKPIRVRQGTRAANRVVAEFSFDAAGRVLARRDAAGKVTRLTYSPRGDVASVSEEPGGTTKFAYDALGRITAVDRNGAVERVAYDPRGRVASRVSPEGVRTDFRYDATGQMAEVRTNDRPGVSLRRDALGRVTEETDALGRRKTYAYDERGNLLAEHAANGAVTRYEYDAKNRRTAQIDGNGNRIRFDYDPAGRLVRQTNALGKTLTWTYDPAGQLVERANGVQTTKFFYDERKRLVRTDYNAPSAATGDVQPGGPQTIDYTYDAKGRLLTAATPDTRVENLYDANGRVEARRYLIGTDEQLVRYRYDAAGRRTGLLLAEFVPAVASANGRAGQEARYEVLQQTEYAYDAAGRLAAILSQGDPVVTYAYDAAGRLTGKTFGNGMRSAITYDAAGRLARTTFSGGPLSEPKILKYTWDDANQVTKRAWNGQTQLYGYDPSGQLLSVTDEATGEKLETYRYDAAGNMLEKVFAGEKTTMRYNVSNELVTRAVEPAEIPKSKIQNLSYAYDAAGRLLGYEGGQQSAYGWLDKIIELKLLDGQKFAYSYWPDGQLAKKMLKSAAPDLTDKTGVQRIANSPSAFNSQPSTAPKEQFLWDGLALLRRNDTIYLIEPHPSGGVPIASHPVNDPSEVTYYLNDMLGTTLATLRRQNAEYAQLSSFGQPRRTPNLGASISPHRPSLHLA